MGRTNDCSARKLARKKSASGRSPRSMALVARSLGLALFAALALPANAIAADAIIVKRAPWPGSRGALGRSYRRGRDASGGAAPPEHGGGGAAR